MGLILSLGLQIRTLSECSCLLAGRDWARGASAGSEPNPLVSAASMAA